MFMMYVFIAAYVDLRSHATNQRRGSDETPLFRRSESNELNLTMNRFFEGTSFVLSEFSTYLLHDTVFLRSF